MAKCDDARLKVMLTFNVMCTVCRCGGQKAILFSLNDTIYISLGVGYIAEQFVGIACGAILCKRWCVRFKL